MFKWAIRYQNKKDVRLGVNFIEDELFNNQLFNTRARARYYKRRYNLRRNWRVMRVCIH